MAQTDRVVGDWVPAVNTTVAANAITTTISAPGAGRIAGARCIHMRVDPADGGSGDVTFVIQVGAIVRRWVRPFVAGQGATCDYTPDIWPAANSAVVLSVARTGLTSGAVVHETATIVGGP